MYDLNNYYVLKVFFFFFSPESIEKQKTQIPLISPIQTAQWRHMSYEKNILFPQII